MSTILHTSYANNLVCDISATYTNLVCDDNGTPDDPNDDTFTIDILVTGTDTGPSWIADDINMTSGAYDVPLTIGPFDVFFGDLNLTITDDTDPACITTIEIEGQLLCCPAFNDECANALDLMNVFEGCNYNATEDIDIGCGAAENEASVWFYHNSLFMEVTDLDISINSISGIPLSFAVYDASAGCGSPTLLGSFCNTEFGLIECVTTSEIYVVVSSSAADAQEFNISVVELGQSNPSSDCNTSDNIFIEPCVTETVFFDTTDACPELESPPGCNMDIYPTVWGSVFSSASITGVEISNISGDAEITIYNGCPSIFGEVIASCITADEAIMIDGDLFINDLYFAISTPTESSVTFDLNVLNEACASNPADLCVNAEAILSGIVLNNIGTTEDVDLGCGASANEASVWFEYTITDTYLSSFSIDLNTITGGPYSFAIYDACGGTQLVSACGTNFASLSCIELSSVYIVVSSEVANTGEFTLDITEESYDPFDYSCFTATAEFGDNCVPTTFFVDLTMVCPFELQESGCNSDTDYTYWIEYISNSSFSNLDFMGLDGSFNITLYDDCSGNIVGPSCFNSDQSVSINPPLNTVFIAVSSETPDGYFFDIETTAENDACANAILLPQGQFDGCNIGANPDVDLGCGPAINESTLWYQYDMNNSMNSLELNFDFLLNDWGFAIFDATQGCNSPTLIESFCEVFTGTVNCVGVESVYIVVGSSIAESENFFIEINEISSNSCCDAANDECETAEQIIVESCLQQSIIGTTIDACPEDFSISGCNLDTDPTVWYEFVTPPGTTDLEFSNFSGDPNIMLFDACPLNGGNMLFPNCLNTDQIINNIGSNTTLFMSVSTTVAGPFTFDLTAISQSCCDFAINDACADAIPLATATNANLNNDCSGSNAPFGTLNNCPAQSVSTVWYTYDPIFPLSSISFELISTGIVDPVFEIYSSDNGFCNTLTVLDGLCSEGTITIDCPPDNIYIQVASPLLGQGEFTIIVDESVATGNDDCTLSQVETLEDCETLLIGGTTIGMCPESFNIAGCNLDTYPTTWHEITVASNVTAIEFSNVLGNLELNVWEACPPAGNALTPTCINGPANVAVVGGSTYYISASTIVEADYFFEITPTGCTEPCVTDPIVDAFMFPSCVDINADDDGDGSPDNIICDLNILNGACYNMPSTITGNGPSPACNGGTIENVTWFAFAAGTGNYQIEFTPNSCTAPNDGIEVGIYSDCSFQNLIWCGPSTCTGPETITTDFGIFTPGDIYYVYLDGCNGSVCNVDIQINGSFTPFALFDNPIETSYSCSPEPPCPGALIDFFAPDYENSNLAFTWTITGATGTDIIIDDYLLTYSFPVAGAYSITYEVSNGCSSITTEIFFEVFDVEEVSFGVLSACGGEIVVPDDVVGPDGNTYAWAGAPIVLPDNSGPGTIIVESEAIDITACGCEIFQFVTIEVLPPSVGVVELTICADDFPYTYEGEIFDGPVNLFEVNLEGQNINGCDSTVFLTLLDINADGQLVQSACENGITEVEWIGNVTPSGTAINYSWWDGPGGTGTNLMDGLGNDATIEISNSSVVYLIITATSSTGTVCEFEFGPLVITIDIPEDPVLLDPNFSICVEDANTETYCVINDPSLIYNWTVSDGSIIVGQGSSCVTIDFDNVTNPVDLCISTENDCGGISNVVCETINLVNAPDVAISGDQEVCIDDFASISYDWTGTGGPPNTYNYFWNFNGATVIPSNTNGPGPFNVNWNTPGIKLITLQIDDIANDGCISETVEFEVFVQESTPFPIISCDETSSEIVFSWPPVMNSTAYIVNVITGQTGILDNNAATYTVSNLNPGEFVEIEISAELNDICMSTNIVTASCIAQDCDLPTIALSSSDPDNTVCENDDILLDIFVSFDPSPLPGYTATLSGSGIVNGDQFDPALAGVGVHTILLNYTNPNDPCVASSNMLIEVLPQPVAEIVAADLSLCTEDATTITINNLGTNIIDFVETSNAIVTPTSDANIFLFSWSSGGSKTVSLELISTDGCRSNLASLTIEVSDQIDIPEISCNSDESTLSFNWIENPAANYTVNLITGTAGVQTTGAYTVSNVSPGDQVSISVTISPIDGVCPEFTTDPVTCETVACPDISIIFENLTKDICLNSGLIEFKVDIIIDGQIATDGNIMWSGPGILDVTSSNFDPLIAGVGSHVITAIYTDASGFCSTMQEFTIEVLENIEAKIATESQNVCVSDQLELVAEQVIGTEVVYNWGIPASINTSGNLDTHGPIDLSFTMPGIYTISLSVESNGCISETKEIVLTVDEELIAPAIDCSTQGDSLVFTWNSVAFADSYAVDVITGNEGMLVNDTTFIVSPVLMGESVSIELTVVSANTCDAVTSSANCSQSDCPEIELIPEQAVIEVCIDENGAELVNISNITVLSDGIPSTADYTLTYTGSDAVISETGEFDPIIAGIGTTIITVKYSDTDGCESSTEISIRVQEIAIPVILSELETICAGENFELLAQEIENVEYVWEFPDAVNGAALDSPGPFELSIDEAGMYTFNLSIMLNECVSETVSYTIEVEEAPEEEEIICDNSNTAEILFLWNSVSCTDSFDIYINDEFIVRQTETSYVATDLGSGETVSIIVDVVGCLCGTVSMTMECSALETDLIFIEVMSPDKDNNKFLQFSEDNIIEGLTLTVFNRWGDEIFKKENYTNDWDAEGYPGGIYFYVVEYEGQVIKKTLTVLR